VQRLGAAHEAGPQLVGTAPFDGEDLDGATGRLAREQARRDHAGVVHHQQRALGQERRQLGEPVVLDRPARRHDHEARGIPPVGRGLRDQLVRQRVIEVGEAQRG
jgi:hypothetical protein